MKQQNAQILVLGAGYGGMMAALRLAGKTKNEATEITLINAVDHFVQRPRLHQLATDQKVPTKSMVEMLRGTNVRFVKGLVTQIDSISHTVAVTSDVGTKLFRYNHLVYALGSRVDREGVPGVSDYAFTLDPYGPRSAPELNTVLRGLQGAQATVVVVGGGATGVEGATEIKGRYPQLRVTLVTNDTFGSFKGSRVERHIRSAFRSQGIDVLEGRGVREVGSDHLQLEDGDIIPADLVLWAGGFRAPSLAREAGLAVNERNQILVDPFLRSISHPEIYAVGDSAQPVEDPGVKMRMSIFGAITGAAQAADNLVAQIKGKPQKPLSFVYYGQAIALGPNDAAGFASFPADEPLGPIYRGRLAVWLRAFFVWSLFYFLELERKFPGFYFWLGKDRYARLKRARAAEGSRAEPRATQMKASVEHKPSVVPVTDTGRQSYIKKEATK